MLTQTHMKACWHGTMPGEANSAAVDPPAAAPRGCVGTPMEGSGAAVTAGPPLAHGGTGAAEPMPAAVTKAEANSAKKLATARSKEKWKKGDAALPSEGAKGTLKYPDAAQRLAQVHPSLARTSA
jgi:hypothetical protein